MDVSKPRYLLVTLALVLALASCGKRTRKPPEEVMPLAVPAGMVIEGEIGGSILGAKLSRPFGLAVSKDNFVYCVDGGNNRLLQFRSDMTPVRSVGGTGVGDGLLDRPSFVTVDNELNVLISDEGNRRISRYNSHLVFVEEIPFEDPEDPLRFGTPSGVAVNVYGEMWVADRERNRIAVYRNVGTFDRFIADFGYQGGQVASPEEIAVDRFGHFVVCDAGNSRVIVYDQYGNHVRTLRNTEFDYPMATVPEKDAYWILDGAAGRVYYTDQQGDILFVAGPQIAGSDIFLKEPSDIAQLPDGRLLIADSGNNRLLICRPIVESE